ncbi:unnamed protein product, partial [Adineta steineri]
MPSYPKHLKT